jgi:hypothetical protein
MLLKSQDIALSLKLAQDFGSQHDKRVGKPEGVIPKFRSIDIFEELIRASGIVVEIELLDLSHATQAVRGMCLPKKDNKPYTIVLLEGQRPCWIRFVKCKELFHVLLDLGSTSKTHRSMDIEKHIDQTVCVAIEETRPSAATVNEILAELAAMEFMLPLSARQKYVETDDLNFTNLAEKYKCPLHMVEKYFHPANMKTIIASNPVVS